MGLDMYLSARRYISHYDFPPQDQEVGKAVATAIGHDYSLFPITGVEVQLMYWRKANQIHSWFVENVQKGVDECQLSSVDPAKLEELLALTSAALLNRDSSLLAPKSGFFFGSTEIDEWYWKDLENTEAALKSIVEWLKLPANEHKWDVYYQSSW